MRQDDARKLAREILRGLLEKERNAGTAGFLSYKLLRRLAVHAQLLGLRLEGWVPGPWSVGESAPGALGRLGVIALPTVERNGFHLLVPDVEEANRLAAFLNWCNAPEPERS